MLLIAMLAATVWAMPSGQPALKTAADRSPAPQESVAPVCQQTRALPTAKSDARAHRLDEEPRADGYAAVLYSEGNCTKPLKVSRDIGMNMNSTTKPATR